MVIIRFLLRLPTYHSRRALPRQAVADCTHCSGLEATNGRRSLGVAMRLESSQLISLNACLAADLKPSPLGYYPGNKEGHIPTRSASEGPMKSSESRRGSPLDD